jgi:1-acyl-sn-glycerol-3-phosphate acyltransferase
MAASGYIYGFWGGTLVTWIGLTLGGQMAFWLARRFGRPFALRFISSDVLDRWDRLAAKQGIGFYIVTLLLPFFPNDAMCYVAGLGEIHPRRFAIANMIGRFLATTAMTFIGAFGSQIPLSVWVSSGIFVGLVTLAWHLHRKGFRFPFQVSSTKFYVMLFKQILKGYLAFTSRGLEISGQSKLPAGPKIIVANHTNGSDPVYLAFVTEEPPHTLFQNGLFTIPVLGWLMRKSQQICVDRQHGRPAFDEACAYLRHGQTVALFPEGQLCRREARVPAKSGAIRMALETGAPIIPLGFYVRPQDLVRLQIPGKPAGDWQISGKCYARFGEPIHADPGVPLDVQTAEMMDQIYILVDQLAREKTSCALPIALKPIHQW